jgi:hypothetical protein
MGDPVIVATVGHIERAARVCTARGVEYHGDAGLLFARRSDGMWQFASPAGPQTWPHPAIVRACDARDRRPS